MLNDLLSRLLPSRATVLVVAVLACAGCGGATGPAADSPADEEGTEEGTAEEPEELGEGATARRGGKCFEQCAEYIEDASALLDQAKALEGAEKAQVALFTRAGDAFVKAWRGCDLRLPRGEDLSCKGAEQVVPKMVEAYAGAQRPDRLVYACLVALDERWRDDAGELAGEAPSKLRSAAAKAAEVAQDPKAPHAAESMAAAVYGMLALDEVTEAERLAARHAKRFGRTAPESVSLVAAALAAYFNDREQWQEAVGALGGATNPSRAKHAPAKILWHSEKGRALAGLGRTGPAAREFQQVRASWRTPDPKDPSKMVGRQEPAPMLGRERVVDAVGAANLYLAEPLRRKADALAPPRYRGAQTPDGVEKYIGGPLVQWAHQRQRLIAAASKQYERVLQIRPVPPPRWVVAAQAEIGQMWDRFADAMVSVELPPKLASDEGTKSAFEKALSGSASPARDQARQAFEACQKTASTAGIDSPHAEACERWLEK